MKASVIIFKIFVTILGLTVGGDSHEDGQEASLSEAEWRDQYNELFALNKEVTPFEPEKTLSILKSLHDAVFGTYAVSNQRIKDLIGYSNITADKCDYLPYALQSATSTVLHQVHLLHYVEHYINKQKEFCFDPIDKEIIECHNRLSDQHRQDLELLYKSVPKDGSDLFSISIGDDLRGKSGIRFELLRITSFNYLRSKIGDVKNVIGWPQNKKNFIKMFGKYLVKVCDRVLVTFAGPLEKTKGFDRPARRMPWELFGKRESEILKSVKLCKLLVWYQADVINEAYNSFKAGDY